MKFSRYLIPVILLYLFSFCLTLAAEELPGWVIFEQGRQHFINREYGQALDLLKRAIAVKGQYPEAEFMIGEIFVIEGELGLAKQQFQKAYAQQQYLDVPDEKYPALYKLAEIYLQAEEYKNYEDTLLKILTENRDYYENKFSRYKNKFLEIYAEEGLDRMMVLYRLPETFAAGAHGELGWFYYKSGRYSPSLIHSLFAVNIILTEVIDTLRTREPQFKYTTLKVLLDLVLERIAGIPADKVEYASYPQDSLKNWLLGEADLFRKLYYLACASYAAGKRSQAEKLWQIISGSTYAGQYGKLAGRQLVSPWIEDYLDVQSGSIGEYQNSHQQ